MNKVIKIRSCIEIWANNIKIYGSNRYVNINTTE